LLVRSGHCFHHFGVPSRSLPCRLPLKFSRILVISAVNRWTLRAGYLIPALTAAVVAQLVRRTGLSRRVRVRGPSNRATYPFLDCSDLPRPKKGKSGGEGPLRFLSHCNPISVPSFGYLCGKLSRSYFSFAKNGCNRHPCRIQSATGGIQNFLGSGLHGIDPPHPT